MNSLDVKICGLSTPETVRSAIDAGASHTGYIFFEKSPRHVTPGDAAHLAAIAKDRDVRTVAVTVNADDAYLTSIVNEMQPDILQLHGKETPERLTELKERYGLEIWKALAISIADDIAKLAPYSDVADRFLLDAKPPKGSELPGGNAVSFDWSILDALPDNTDYLLAGGIDASNVAAALAANPKGLDISSGVESSPGVKEPRLIAALFDAINAARNQHRGQNAPGVTI